MVKVTPRADRLAIDHMERGINLEGRKTLPAKVEEVGHTSEGSTLRITLVQGMKNQIKRMADVEGLKVVSLKRVRVGPVSLKGMSPGQIRELRTTEIAALHKILEKHNKP
jgi:23S rRNA pseudouridine2605 synthase/16S rRNA pseudouridine516 synthase